MSEQFTESAVWKLAKFNDPTGEVEAFTRSGHSYQEAVVKFPEKHIGTSTIPVAPDENGNVLLNNGITVMLNILCGVQTTPLFNNAGSRLGVGDSNTAENATQTGLQAATNHYWLVADATYPQVAAQTITWQGTFGGSTANYLWTEFVVDDYGSAGSTASAPTYDSTRVALNRKMSGQGTKTSGQTWVLTLALTIS